MKDFNYQEFMDRLHEQTSGGDDIRERQNKAIMRIIGSWVEKRTPEYIKATDNGESDAEYLGAKAKKACIDRALAWNFASKFLLKYHDPERPNRDIEGRVRYRL
jgi:hypothetical protein